MENKRIWDAPPLIKWVDVPDHTLDKDFVFIHCHQRAQHVRSEFGENNWISWSIAFETFMETQSLQFVAGYSRTEQFGMHFFSGLPSHKCFSLRKKIGEENL